MLLVRGEACLIAFPGALFDIEHRGGPIGPLSHAPARRHAMHRDEQIRLLKLLMDHLDNDTTVDAGGMRENPAWVYTSQEHADKEWEAFFRAHPQVVGMSGELPENGSFRTIHDFGVPLLITRDEAGRFRASQRRAAQHVQTTRRSLSDGVRKQEENEGTCGRSATTNHLQNLRST